MYKFFSMNFVKTTSKDDQSCVRTTRIYLTLITTVKTIHVTRRHWKERLEQFDRLPSYILWESLIGYQTEKMYTVKVLHNKFTRLFCRLPRMRRMPQRAPKKASKTVYFISGPTHTSLSWYIYFILRQFEKTLLEYIGKCSKSLTNFYFFIVQVFAENQPRTLWRAQHGWQIWPHWGRLQSQLSPWNKKIKWWDIYFTVAVWPILGVQCQGQMSWGGDHKRWWSMASRGTSFQVQ